MSDRTQTNSGIVWLVGAGPGDPGLITVRGASTIVEADVIVYDNLANPSLLDDARPDAELIYAGKKAGQHTMKQEEINELLHRKAAAGLNVCRLKGGDPFVFGRGGEEAEYLRERGIPVEIVSGVTSAIAAPACAGIPVTHRGLATSCRFVTGHEDPTKSDSDLDWDDLGSTEGTLVFLMTVKNLAETAAQLIAHGKTAMTPAAMVQNGTLPTQQVVTGTLRDIADRAHKAGIRPPAVLVVGEVASLRERLQWFENRPLFGRAIAVTRARAQASELVEHLTILGAQAIEAPAIRIEWLSQTNAMRQAAQNADGYDWVIFTSVNGVDAFWASLALERSDSRALGGVKVAAIGSATALRLAEKGIHADLIPERFVAEGILEELDKTETFTSQRYLLPRAKITRPDLVDGLRQRGATVNEVDAYRTVAETSLPPELAESLVRGRIDLVTFTSSSTVHNFIQALPDTGRAELTRHIRAASIGPVTSKTLADYGITPVVEAAQSTIPGLVSAMQEYFEKQ